MSLPTTSWLLDAPDVARPILDSVTYDGRQVLLIGGDTPAIVWQVSDWESVGSGNIDVETAHIRLGDMQAMQRMRWMMLLGEIRSACSVRIRVAYDYAPAWVDDKTMEISGTVGDPVQIRHGFSRQKCQALKVRVTVMAPGGASTLLSEGLKLTGITFEVAMKRGAYKYLPAGRKQ